jgi:hypothetical protein
MYCEHSNTPISSFYSYSHPILPAQKGQDISAQGFQSAGHSEERPSNQTKLSMPQTFHLFLIFLNLNLG